MADGGSGDGSRAAKASASRSTAVTVRAGSGAGSDNGAEGFGKVFLLAAVIYSAGALAFALTAKGTPQFDDV